MVELCMPTANIVDDYGYRQLLSCGFSHYYGLIWSSQLAGAAGAAGAGAGAAGSVFAFEATSMSQSHLDKAVRSADGHVEGSALKIVVQNKYNTEL